MLKKNRIIAIYCWCMTICVTSQLFAQAPEPLEIPQTAQLWAGITAKFDLTQKLRFALSTQMRADDDQQYPIDRLFIEPSLRYDLPQHLELRGGYRYGQRWGRNAQHRFWGSLSYSPDLGKHWQLKLSTILQTDVIAQQPIENTFRPQIDLAYRTHKKAKWIPELGLDVFYLFNYRYHTIERYRINAGFSYRLYKNGDLSLKYTQQRYINIGKPQLDHIINIGYDVTIKQAKKKQPKAPKEGI